MILSKPIKSDFPLSIYLLTGCDYLLSERRKQTKKNPLLFSLSRFLFSLPPLPHPPLSPPRVSLSILPHPSKLAPPPGDAKPEEDEEVCSISSTPDHKQQKRFLPPEPSRYFWHFLNHILCRCLSRLNEPLLYR